MAEVKQDVKALLLSLNESDQVFKLSCQFTNLHATQGINECLTSRSHLAEQAAHETTHTEGIPSGESAQPQKRKRGRSRTTTREIQTYQFAPVGRMFAKVKQPCSIYLEVGGPYGLMAKALRDAVVAKDRAKYWLPGLSLISFRPVKPVNTTGLVNTVEVKVATILDLRMEPRHSSKGKDNHVMVAVYHERLNEPVVIDIEMVVNSECPRTIEEICGLLHAMQSVPFGPARRGVLKILDAKRVQ